jgi:hypothetical protein
LGGAFIFYGSLPTTYFLIKRLLEFNNQLPKRVLGFTINPLRVNTDGGCSIMSRQVLQMLAEFPCINFGTSFWLRSQKAHLADGSVFTGKKELFSMHSKQIKASNNPGKKLPISRSVLPQKLHFGTWFIAHLLTHKIAAQRRS